MHTWRCLACASDYSAEAVALCQVLDVLGAVTRTMSDMSR